MARAKVTRRMTRKDGNAKGVISSYVKVSTAGPKTTVSASKKVVPYVKSN